MINKKQLTLIEDDEIIVFLTKKLIKDSGYIELLNVLTNGQKAIDYFIENKTKADKLPDIIFLDLSMPVYDGWQFLEGYKKIQDHLIKKIEIYITTSSISPQDIRKAEESGVPISDFIIKPISEQSLKNIYERIKNSLL